MSELNVIEPLPDLLKRLGPASLENTGKKPRMITISAFELHRIIDRAFSPALEVWEVGDSENTVEYRLKGLLAATRSRLNRELGMSLAENLYED